jgi:hypothetical protein
MTNKQRLNKEWAERNKEKIKTDRAVYKQIHKEEIARKRKIWVKCNKNTPEFRFSVLKSKCSYYKYDLDLTIDDCVALWAKGCFYCKKDVSMVSGIALDRINNERGYTKDNVLPCCGICNLIRGDNLTVNEMEIAMWAIIEFRVNHNL